MLQEILGTVANVLGAPADALNSLTIAAAERVADVLSCDGGEQQRQPCADARAGDKNRDITNVASITHFILLLIVLDALELAHKSRPLKSRSSNGYLLEKGCGRNVVPQTAARGENRAYVCPAGRDPRFARLHVC